MSAKAILFWGQSETEGNFGPSPNPQLGTLMSATYKVWDYNAHSLVNAALGTNPFTTVNGVISNNYSFVACKEYCRHENNGIWEVLLAEDGKKIEYFLFDEQLTANGWTNTQTGKFGTSASGEIAGNNPSNPGESRQALNAMGRTQFDCVVTGIGATNLTSGDSTTTIFQKLKVFYQMMDGRGFLTLGITPLIFLRLNPSYNNVSRHNDALDMFQSQYSNVHIMPWNCESFNTLPPTDPNYDANNRHATPKGLEQQGLQLHEIFAQVL